MLKTMMELQEMAKELGIKDYSKYKKTELAQLVFEKMPKPDKHEEIDQENEEISVADDKFEKVEGVLEVMADGYGFIRGENYLPTNKDVYVSANQIKRFNLKTGDKITGNTREARAHEKLKPLILQQVKLSLQLNLQIFLQQLILLLIKKSLMKLLEELKRN